MYLLFDVSNNLVIHTQKRPLAIEIHHSPVLQMAKSLRLSDQLCIIQTISVFLIFRQKRNAIRGASFPGKCSYWAESFKLTPTAVPFLEESATPVKVPAFRSMSRA